MSPNPVDLFALCAVTLARQMAGFGHPPSRPSTVHIDLDLAMRQVLDEMDNRILPELGLVQFAADMYAASLLNEPTRVVLSAARSLDRNGWDVFVTIDVNSPSATTFVSEFALRSQDRVLAVEEAVCYCIFQLFGDEELDEDE